MVDLPNEQYLKRMEQWRVIRDCIEGEDAVKAAGEKYLPRHTGSTNVRYDAYKKRAQWVNYTAQTLSGLHGMITRRMPVIDASDDFIATGVLNNIDRKGNSLYQFISTVLEDCMQTCFGGLFVDMPKADDVISVYDAEEKGIRPYIRYYPAESVINWKFRDVDGTEQLCMVVLKEVIENEAADEFAHEKIIQYRVLDLDKAGFYRQRIFSPQIKKEIGHDGKEHYVYDCVEIPILINGEKIRYIPFSFVPFAEPEKPMLYDLACVNICHYRESADYENGVHLTTLPTLIITGWDPVEGKDGKKPSIHIGGDVALTFEDKDTKVNTESFSGVGLQHCETAMSRTEQQMAILGSRIISPDKAMAETADAARIHRAGENAKLASFTRNMSDKISEVVSIVARWMGFLRPVNIHLNTDYETLEFDPNALNAVANLAREGKIPLQYIFYMLKKGEYLPDDATFDEYAKMLDFEQSGATQSEILEFYKALKEGIDFKIPKRDVEQDIIEPAKNDKEEIA